MGAAGDMLMAALLELIDDPDGFLKELSSLGLPGVSVSRETVASCGIKGTHVRVRVGGEEEGSHDEKPSDKGRSHHGHMQDAHSHGRHHGCEHSGKTLGDHEHTRGMTEVHALINSLSLPDTVRRNACGVYELIAGAEAAVHGKEMSQIHFHELGTLDAVCDIVGVSMLIERLAPDCIAASPVHVGSGHVRCAHGVLPVPAPATALLLEGIPIYGGDVSGELCTPTGAALLKYFVRRFGPMPVMAASKIGYGMGSKQFEAANCIRAFWGESDKSVDAAAKNVTSEAMPPNGTASELSCNLDDMSGELVAFAAQRLLEHGARDVFITPIQMKKGRPGIKLTCICSKDSADYFASLMLKYTSSLGVRRFDCVRYEMERKINEADTKWGKVRIKYGKGYGTYKKKPEYDDAERLAIEHDISIQEVLSINEALPDWMTN